jgi:hypothetical protein
MLRVVTARPEKRACDLSALLFGAKMNWSGASPLSAVNQSIGRFKEEHEA